tara:strand:+ start:1577 stop:2065 length:489 start_codon:yes stop_codon:yes gene_type:complete
MLGTILTAIAPEIVSRGAKYLYDISGIGDMNFMGQPIGDYLSSQRVSQAAAGITKTAIEQKLLPDYGNMPKSAGIPQNLGQVRVGPPGGFDPISRGGNLLYTGNTDRITKNLTKPQVKQHFINRITPEDVVRFRRLQGRKIRQAGTSLQLAALKRGQITRPQ